MSEENSKIFLSVHFSSFFLSLLRRESKRNANPFKMAKAGKVKKGGNNRIKRKPGILWQNRKDKKTIKHVEDTFDWVFKKIDKMGENCVPSIVKFIEMSSNFIKFFESVSHF
eukprot:TRINITY_DN3426_c0_g1_i2.p1 TRINITY_DN3426_c0_g1~~TRINITY_DN3426_c0_g1_i2.p1  ORF type:complete len:112 (+),score=22.66 TRINITY_DN3426_c0_g1_i2:118-453(+)